MLWFLFLLFTYVRADDDSLDFGPPELPPLDNANIDNQIGNVLVDQFYGAYKEGTGNKRPRFKYPKHLYYNTELFTLMQDCYDAGMAPPLKYPIDMTIWDNRWSRLKRVEKGTYYCAPGFTEKWYWTWKVHSNDRTGIASNYPNYNPEELASYKYNLLTSFETQTSLVDPPEVIAWAVSGGITGAKAAVAGLALATGGVGLAASGAAAAAGFAAGYAGAHAAVCDVGREKQAYYCKGKTGRETVEQGMYSGSIVNIPYPVSDEEIKWTAPAYVRKTYALYEEAPSTYCSLWNTISGNGIEYFRPPKVFINKTRTCKDYGLRDVLLCTKDVTERTTDDERQLEFIEKHPNLLYGDTFDEACNHPSNLFCQSDSTTREISENLWRNAYAEATPYGLDTTVLKDKLTMSVGELLLKGAAQYGQSAFNIAKTGTVGMVDGIGRLMFYTFNDFDTANAEGYNFKYSSDDIVQPVLDENELEWVQGKIVEAQTAVMAWAQSDCYSYKTGKPWSPDADFSCLIGVNDIKMKGASQTIPLGSSGIGAGLLNKHVAKRGVSMITKGHYTYCVSSTEYAFMAGEKFTLSPVAFRKKDVTKLLGQKSGKQAGKKAEKTVASTNKNVATKKTGRTKQYFNKCKGNPYCKAAAKTYGRESSRQTRREIEQNTGLKLKFIYEFWQEYGTCDDGCDFTAKESYWDLVAGSMSFFTAKTALTRLQIWDDDHPNGWDRKLHQVYAHVSLVPNPVQVAFAFSGGLIGVLAEFQIGMETARGEGNRDPINIFGNVLTDDNRFGSEKEWITRLGKTELITLAPTEMTKYGISKDVLYIKGSRRRLSSDDKHSVPDIAIAETLRLDTENPIRLNKRGMVIPRYINATQSNIDLSRLDSIIYGVQDDILEAESLVNPFRYTTLNETTLELEYNPAPYHVIDLNSCESAGFTSVHLLDHTFNSDLKDEIFNYIDTQPIDTTDLNGDTYTYSERTINFQRWRHDGSEWYYDGDSSPKTLTLDDGTSVTVDPNDSTMHEEVVENGIKGADRPVGLILGPLKENGVSDLRQTTYDLYGAFGSSRKRHTSCSPEMKCVCVYTSGYRYMRYGDIGDEYKDGSYMINPVYTMKECITAIHNLYNDDYLTFTQWTIVSTGLNETVELKEDVDGAFRGCVQYGESFYFYKGEGDNMGSLGDNSIVRLHKLSTPAKQTYSGDIINVYREKPFTDMKTIHTSIDHQAVGHHIFEEGHPVWFPKYKYNAIKDKNAHYTVHNDKFKTIRRVDRYYKRNKDVVEEYYIDDEGAPTLEYMELKSMSARSNIYGETTLDPGAHFIATARSVGLGVIVPKMDFVRDGKVAFIGEKISMDVLPCRSLFDYSGDAKYCTDTSCENIPGENFICGEVSPPTLENSMSCDRSRSLPNTCPVGYGMDGDGADINGVSFKIGDLRQCAKCPIVSTCNHVCKRCLNGDPDTCDDPQPCKECLSPSGSYRCNVDLTNCDKPGYMKTYTRRGGTGAQVSTHCVKTFEEPDFLPWQTSTLQKYHHEKGNPFYPVEHEYDEKRYIQNELYSETRYLVCQPGFVPTQKLVTSIAEYAQTCAGYTCERCPDGFYEEDQICRKCPNRQIANATGTGCEYVHVPKGHFFNLQNNRLGCSIDAIDETTCESTSVNTWLGCTDNTLKTETECLAEPKNTWGVEGICSNSTFTTQDQCLAEKTKVCSDSSFTTQEDCIRETVNTWEVKCSEPRLTDEETCTRDSYNVWSDEGGCQPETSHLTETDCLARSKYTWGYVCSNPGYTHEEGCMSERKNTWGIIDVNTCSDGTSATEEECLSNSKNTWGVMCSSPSFTSEESCTGERANTWSETNVNTWTTSCSNIGFYTETGCLEEKTEVCTDIYGDDVTDEYSSYDSCIDNEGIWSMTDIPVNTWSGQCSNPTFTSQDDCLAEKTKICSDGISETEEQCLEASKHTWGVMCSEPRFITEENCTREHANIWTEASDYVNTWTLLCSDSNFITQDECLAEPKNSWDGCSDESLKTQSTCLKAKGVWNNQEDLFISSCDHWLDHPGGSMGAYQDEENQIMCKTVNYTKGILGSHPVMFKGGIVEYRGESGWRVSQNRTQAVQCGEHQICNGEEVSGCKPGYIWTEFSENRDFDPCQECNANEDIFSKHPERDNYEYCDGSHRFRCAKFSYTNATVDTFRAHTGNHSQAGDIFVGVRASWDGSNLVLPRTERRGDMYRTFDWSNEFNPALPRAEQYVYNANFKPRRYPENEAFNRGVKCEPVPNGTFALPDKWQKTDCGAARELCVHRTFHSIVPFKPNCADVPYYPFTSKAVKEECYDYIYRMEDRICTDGLKQSGVEKPETLKCKKDYCNIEGQSNCWCGDEEDFCTMGCVDGLCQEICGDRVCEEYEVCYGKFNQFESFARCAIKCQAPRSNFCVIENAEGNAVFCRHYNEDWNSPIMQKLEPKPTGPCFDEVPSIPETQCRDVFDTSCFCGREFFDPPHTHEDNRFACHEKKLKPFCSVLQDDGTCIYETSSDGKCLCGLDEIDLTLSGSRCYSDDEGSCGVHARGKPMCEDHVHSESDGGCIAGNFSITDNLNCYNGEIVKEYLDIGGDESYRCVQDGEILEVKGCMDPLSDIHNPYATIPGKCKY